MAEAKIIISAVDNTKVAFDSIKTRLTNVSGAVTGLGIGVAAAALANMTRSAANFADEMGKAAQKVGTTTEALSSLKVAADLSDVSFEQLQVGLSKLAKSAEDFRDGSKGAIEAFGKLGIDPARFEDSAQLFEQVAEQLSKMEDGARKTAIAQELLGKSGAQLIPLLNGGAAGLRAAREEAEQFGLIVSTQAAKAAEEFNDNLTRLGQVTSGLKVQAFGPLVEDIGEVSRAVLQAAKDAGVLTAAWVALGGAAAIALGQTDRQQNNARLADLNKQIETARRQFDAGSLNPNGASDRFFNFLIPDVKLNPKARAKLKSNLDALVAERDKLLKEMEPKVQPKRSTDIPGDEAGGGDGKPRKTPIDQDAAAAARFVEQIKKQAETLGFTQDALLRYEAAHLKLTPAQKATVDASIRQIAAFEEEKRLAEETAEAYEFLQEQSERQNSDDLADIEAQAAEQESLNQSIQNYISSIERAIDPTIELADKIGKVQSALSLGLISQADADRLIEYLETAKDKTKEATDDMRDAARDLGLTFSSDFEDAIVGAESLSEVLKGLEQDIVRIITRKLVTEPLADSVTGLLDGFDFGNLFGDLFGFANGGIMTSGGPLPLQKYASGGIANRPQLALFGEGSMPEAFVPLPDGRNIPVEMKGGGGSVMVHMTVNTPDANSFRKSQPQIMADMNRSLSRGRRVS